MIINFRKIRTLSVLAAGLMTIAALLLIRISASAGAIHWRPDYAENPRLVNTCLITNNVARLVSFYEQILAIKAKKVGETYAEFSTGGGEVLAIFSKDAQENYIPGSAEAANNKGVILEFRVTDVDQERKRLQGIVKTWVKQPSTTPWGTHSMYFRDPDENLVDFYALVKTQ